MLSTAWLLLIDNVNATPSAKRKSLMGVSKFWGA